MIRNYFCLLIAGACLLALPSTTKAIGIAVDGGDPCQFIAANITDVQPTLTATNPGNFCYDLTNTAGGIVTSITFQIQIDAGLQDPDYLTDPEDHGVDDFVADNFTCDQGGAGYFKDCNITYDKGTGVLTYLFSGVNKPDGDESCTSTDHEINEQEGIPPCGMFHVTLTGWVANATVGDPIQIYMNLPTFDNSETVTPEPSTLFSLGSGLLLLVGVVQFRRRRSASRQS